MAHGTVRAALVGVVALVALTAPAAAQAETIVPTMIPVTPTEGVAFSGPVATFIDNPGSHTAADFTASVSWGDGVTSSGSVTGSDAAGWAVQAPVHTYAEEGTYGLSVTISNSGAAVTVSTGEKIQVADAPLTAPSGSAATFAGTGSSGAPAALTAFQAAIGGASNGSTPAEQPGGFRHIGWDDVKLDGTDPGSTVITAGHTVAAAAGREQAAGLDVGGTLAVSGDGFASINPSLGSPKRFPPVSAQNVISPFNSNVVTMSVVRPSAPGTTPEPQATRGVGLMFLNVRFPNTTRIEYLNGNIVLRRVTAPVGGLGQPVFVGALFPSAVVTSVRITFGSAVIFTFDGSAATPLAVDDGLSDNLVAADDLVLAEPTALAPDIAATAGVPFNGHLDSFVDGDGFAAAGDYVANIDWGDGTRGVGTVSTNASIAGFDLSGTHTYAAAGTFPVTITINDIGGAQRTLHLAAHVAPRATGTVVRCTPSRIALGHATSCTATVSDASAGARTAPGGTVAFTSNGSAGTFAGPSVCTLAAGAAGASSCHVTYVPTAVGSGHHSLTASYGGDGPHAASGGSARVSVGAGGCTIAAPSRLPASRRLAAKVTCDVAGRARLTAVATVAAHGSHHRARLTLGSTGGVVRAHRTATLTVTVSRAAARTLRTAARNHQHISLRFNLTVSTTTSTSVTVGSLRVA